jgi:predicted HicB family RNase H-like nuclease
MSQERKNFTVRLPPALINRVKIRAIGQGVSMEELVRRALELYLKQRTEAGDEA